MLPAYSPAPKSGCSGEFTPIKAMIFDEFGSTGDPEIGVPSVVRREGNKTVEIRTGPEVHPSTRAVLGKGFGAKGK